MGFPLQVFFGAEVRLGEHSDRAVASLLLYEGKRGVGCVAASVDCGNRNNVKPPPRTEDIGNGDGWEGFDIFGWCVPAMLIYRGVWEDIAAGTHPTTFIHARRSIANSPFANPNCVDTNPRQ